jgi:parvulin-like peptidyl-prolyl isomerase
MTGAAFLLAWTIAAASGADAPTTTVALVNGIPIDAAELEASFKQSRISDKAGRIPPADLRRLKLRVLQLLVNRMVLNQRLDELRVKVDEKLVADHVKQVEQRLAGAGQTLDSFLQKLGMTEERMRQDIRNDYRWVAYVESQAKESVLRKYFESNRAAFDGDKVRAKHILIKCGEDASPDERELKRRQASDVRAELAAGKAFEEIARKRSDCPSGKSGGELPWFPRKGMMAEAFAAAAFDLKEGELSQVVETEFGYHVLVVVERKPGEKTARFEDSVDDVKSAYAEDLRRTEVARLRKKADIKILLP